MWEATWTAPWRTLKMKNDKVLETKSQQNKPHPFPTTKLP